MTHQENIISAQIDGGLHEKQTLLDDFAKAAMQGILSAQTEMRANGAWYTPVGASQLAEEAYDIATAMIQERERRMEE